MASIFAALVLAFVTHLVGKWMEMNMELKTYQARSMSDALLKVKRELGRDAIILHTRTLRRGGLLGIGVKTWVEITATADERVAAQRRNVETSKSRNDEAPVAQRGNKQETGDRRLETPSLALQAGSGRTASMSEPAREAALPDTNASAIRSGIDPSILTEIREIRTMVSGLASRSGKGAPRMPAEMADFYTRLIQQHVADEIARQIVDRVSRRLRARPRKAGENEADNQLPQPGAAVLHAWTRDEIQAELLDALYALLPPTAPIELVEGGRTTVVALVGPTGVGKTTTLAKLAANMKLREAKKVGLITIDTYRIAAVEQLKTYAEILQTPLAIVTRVEEVRPALDSMKDMDLVLIDTAGRSQRDEPRIAELAQYLESAGADQVHLVLSSTSQAHTNQQAIEKFAALGARHVIFTKLDEAVGFGAVLGAMRGVDLKLSYLTNGQSVPDDIEPACGRRLARLLLGIAEPGVEENAETPKRQNAEMSNGLCHGEAAA